MFKLDIAPCSSPQLREGHPPAGPGEVGEGLGDLGFRAPGSGFRGFGVPQSLL